MGGLKPARARCLGSQGVRGARLTPEGQQGGRDGGVGCLWELSSPPVIWNWVSLRADLRELCLEAGLFDLRPEARVRWCGHPRPDPEGLPLPARAYLGLSGRDKGMGLSLQAWWASSQGRVGGGRAFFRILSRDAGPGS